MAVSAGRVAVVPALRRLLRASVDERLAWVRINLRMMMELTDHDAAAIHALSGVSAGTVRNFLSGTDSSLSNVLLMSYALGLTLGDLERPPEDFRALVAIRLER